MLKDGDVVEDKNFKAADSGVTKAKLHCPRGDPPYCDFGKDAYGLAVTPIVTNSNPCGMDNQFECSCLPGADYGDVILQVAPWGSSTISCDATWKIKASAATSQTGESGVKHSSLVCFGNKPKHCLFKYVADGSVKESDAFVPCQEAPQPCGRNSEYLCYCLPHGKGAVLGVRKNGHAKTDS